MIARLHGKFEASGQTALVDEGSVHELADRGVVQRFKRQQHATRQQRRHDREVRVLRRRRQQCDGAILDCGQKRILLSFCEPVHLVDEQDRLGPTTPASASRRVDDGADVLYSRVEGRQGHVRAVGGGGDEMRHRRLAAPGRTHRITDMGASPLTSCRSGDPAPSRWFWPISSSIDAGRIRTASGELADAGCGCERGGGPASGRSNSPGPSMTAEVTRGL